jgi:hypothetical protein
VGDLLKGVFVLLELDVGCGLVVVVEGLVGVELDGFLVQVDGLIEVLLLEFLVALVLSTLGRVFHLHLLGLLLFLLRRRRGRGGVLLLVLLLLLGLRLRLVKFLFFELFGEVLEIIGVGVLRKYIKDFLQSGVLLHVDLGQLGVLHDCLELSHEARILEEILGLRVLHQLEESSEVGLVHLGVGSLVLLALCGLEVLLQICVVGVDLESFLVGGDGIVDAVEVEESAALPLVAPRPHGVHLDAGLRILEGLVILAVIEV